jgi:hypothetical protein
MQDLSVRESAVLIGGVKNGRTQTEILPLVRLGIQRFYEDRNESSGP